MTIAKTANSRVFIIEGRASPEHSPEYESCLRMTGLSQGFGDIERIECPDPHKYGAFIEVGQVRGGTERPTTSLEGRYAMNLLSTLLKVARNGCAADVQLHFGQCQDASDFNDFEKIIILEDAVLTNYSTEDLGALASGDNASINETADISAKDAYEVVPLSVASRAGTLLTNEVIDIIICDTHSCGDCENESDGCQKIFAVTKAAGGSLGTPPDIVFSIDGGAVWYAHDIDSMLSTEDPDAVGCLDEYIVVVSNDSNSAHYALKSEFTATTDPDFTEIGTGFVVGGEPNALSTADNFMFIVGDMGYVYGTDDITAGVTVLDAGVATLDRLVDVHAISDTFAVAVGDNATVIYTTNGSTWTPVNVRPSGVGVTLNAVWVRSETEWWVGSSAGRMFYTKDYGATWTEKTFTGSSSGSVLDIQFSSDSVGYMSHQTAGTKGRVFRTFDGGYSWTLIPEKSGTMPANDKINALAVCTYDVNFLAGGGLADDGTDGFIFVASGANA